jgi:hypothetical protein
VSPLIIALSHKFFRIKYEKKSSYVAYRNCVNNRKMHNTICMRKVNNIFIWNVTRAWWGFPGFGTQRKQNYNTFAQSQTSVRYGRVTQQRAGDVNKTEEDENSNFTRDIRPDSDDCVRWGHVTQVLSSHRQHPRLLCTMHPLSPDRRHT